MSEMGVIAEAEARGRTELWPFWRKAYAGGDPLPRLDGAAPRASHRFDEDDPLPEAYKARLLKMLRHEGERAGNKSFLGFMATCLDVAETLYPTEEAKLIKAEYLARGAEARHHVPPPGGGARPRLRAPRRPDAHYAFHLPRESGCGHQAERARAVAPARADAARARFG